MNSAACGRCVALFSLVCFLCISCGPANVAEPDEPFVFQTSLEGKTLYHGETLELAWSHDQEKITRGIVIALSVGGRGGPFYEIQIGEALDNSSSSYTWVIPAELERYNAETSDMDTIPLVSDQCVVKLAEYDSDLHSFSPAFSIKPAP